jgi:GNAT superfamily N-acetyltransferase
MTIEIRDATATDVEDIIDTAREAWYAAYGGFLQPQTIEQALEEYYDPELVEAGIEHEEIAFYVAEVVGEESSNGSGNEGIDGSSDENGGGVIGFASAEQMWADEVELHTLYVHPDRWTGGVGSALLNRVEAWARERGVDRIACAVFSDNAVGVGFFEAKEFHRGPEVNGEVAGERHLEYEFERKL